ncbi:hypothetical protein E2562_033267 [Oryza meyeriana var. granulata]|uniref:BURP domain-containing protein n=2 Tax=Oryza meyeriana var. granulata TaxID=110450 RepID=A0A6G1CW04_9ORYZ|nr:hypothetical protein E2562_033267 [Oryza meyeriana var. granulata]
MDIVVSLISLILLTGGSSGANMAVAMAIPSTTAKDYWQKLFPETLMPPAILDLLTPFPAERLKEVSVSYGSKGDEEPRKAFPMGRYMSNKECEKSLHTNKEGLKEATISYGGEGEEDPMGRYMLDKELKKNIYTTKEELREVSLSYGPEEKLRNLFPTGYEHKNYKHANKVGLNEVSVSYGSDGEEETRKAFPMGQYMLDKEHEKSLHAQKEDLKEVSVSYTSDGEEESRKAFPTGGYILDKEHEKSLNIDKGKDHRRHVHAHSNKMLADVFFFPDVLRPGSIITPTIPPTTSLPALLPRHVADSIPFSTDRFADIVAMFTPASLAMAREIRWALDTCQHPRPLPGEKAGCATSLESLAELAASLLGTREVRAFSAAGLPIDGAGTPARRGRYNVTSVRELSATAGSTSSELAAVVVACHDLTYPYAVFYCHTTKPTAAYAVTLVASDGAASPARMEALAVCHLDTSWWNPENAFFVAHNVKPGEVSVCHFLTKLSIVWVARERDA